MLLKDWFKRKKATPSFTQKELQLLQTGLELFHEVVHSRATIMFNTEKDELSFNDKFLDPAAEIVADDIINHGVACHTIVQLSHLLSVQLTLSKLEE